MATKTKSKPKTAKKPVDAYDYLLNRSVMITTVTMIYTGKLVAIFPGELHLAEAAWIADTGRFSQAVKSAGFNEVEPFDDEVRVVGRGAIIGAGPLGEKHPRSQK